MKEKETLNVTLQVAKRVEDKKWVIVAEGFRTKGQAEKIREVLNILLSHLVNKLEARKKTAGKGKNESAKARKSVKNC